MTKRLLSNRSGNWRAGMPVLLGLLLAPSLSRAGDLEDVRRAGVLRHLGVPYANFVTGSGDGLDVEVARQFAARLGVKYEFVPSTWETLVSDLIGRRIRTRGQDVELLEPAPVRGDIGANGITVLAWRRKVLSFSEPTFPTQVWLVARADASIQPIRPAGDLAVDMLATRRLLRDRSVFCKVRTCLDPALYDLEKHGARVLLFAGQLNELAPAVIKGDADTTILDVPDTLVALEKWPGQIKVIGPISERQVMAAAFPPSSPALRAAFNEFLAGIKKDGTYERLVRRYYPFVFDYFGGFFARSATTATQPASRPAA
jgi:ABC-type amino acid transport substrate-binding protein